MALQSTTQIFIDGNEILSFKRLELIQSIDAHHLLEITCRMDVLETMTDELASETKNFLGQTISIMISAYDSLSGYQNLEFNGIVTAVKNVKAFNHYRGDEVVITAQSPTFLSDDGPHYASYNDASLADVIEKTFRDYDKSKLDIQIEPNNEDPIHYTVQHRESAFHYASRLAAQYGEWFYYNGKKLIFGVPEEEELPLTYNVDLKEYHLELIPQAQNYKFYTNDYLVDETHEKDAKEYTSGANGFNAFVANKSSEIFNKETKVYYNLYNDPQAKERFEAGVETQKKSIEINQLKLTGLSDNPGVKIGGIVVIEGSRYRVVNVSHTTNEIGDYQNEFEAITAEFNAYPKTNIHAFPRSGSQSAIVMENADPDSLGRIRVQFPWQRDMAEMTPWIRIVTPHAGVDKGFHFIPEIGEEVLIGFEGDNAERPYMLGSLYHGNGKPEEWKTDNNDVKAIRTRSGHTIELNDTDGAETIKIYDNDGSIIIFDTQAKSLTINATETIDIAAKNINIVAEEDVNIQAGGDIKTASEGDTEVLSEGDTNLQAGGDTNISSDANVTIEATSDASLSGQNLTVEGQIGADLKGQQTKVSGQMTVIQGASGKIDVV